MPKAAASMYTRKPRPTPPSETIAAWRPWQVERDTRYIMLGPGVSGRPRQSNAKAHNVDVAGKTDPRRVQQGRPAQPPHRPHPLHGTSSRLPPSGTRTTDVSA